MKFFGRQNEIKEFQYRIPGVVDGGHVKLSGIYSTIMDINLKDVSSWVQEYIFRGVSTPLSGSSRYLSGFEKVSS